MTENGPSANRPVDCDVIHPIKEELLVTFGVEGNLVDVLAHTILNMCLTDIPFLEQNDLNGVLTSLRNRDLLFTLGEISNQPCLLEQNNRFSPSLCHWHPTEWTSNRGHPSLKVDGLEGFHAEFPEHCDVILISERTCHQHTRTKFRFDRRMRTYFDTCLAPTCGHRQVQPLANKISIAFVLRMYDDDSTGTYHLGPSRRDDHFTATICTPSDIDKTCLT